ncbi:camphor resistance protein CrcB [Halobacillus karajensis]|uniref:Fluoride-specific ion channel FluC n=1 Tax=Halobacillus karajensis TaxID=195088 RepID=A0A024P5R5_9BACI|nr:fluoride efflux transporter CrcB [Halobacillus karajensis]CDQ17784.1 camphor resistance protein CrcB [Halobacillus karajensis]CDQ24190.1 camphor resistance protein CrcB [Halobacillus karajensis]CDQ29561.1 camphor resistance protein CrcB [Halobacillus karajensis]SEH63926.1 camphor resistance protein CrcB [Halobacillus karajensis]
MIYLYVGIGGLIGASLRFLVGELMKSPDQFPYSTLFVNLTGSFILAWFTMGIVEKYSLTDKWKAALGTGLVGSYTTFSTLSMDAVSLYARGDLLTSLLYITLSIFGGLSFSLLGFYFGKRRTAVS